MPPTSTRTSPEVLRSRTVPRSEPITAPPSSRGTPPGPRPGLTALTGESGGHGPGQPVPRRTRRVVLPPPPAREGAGGQVKDGQGEGVSRVGRGRRRGRPGRFGHPGLDLRLPRP